MRNFRIHKVNNLILCVTTVYWQFLNNHQHKAKAFAPSRRLRRLSVLPTRDGEQNDLFRLSVSINDVSPALDHFSALVDLDPLATTSALLADTKPDELLVQANEIEALGRDILTFLAVSVAVVPLSKILKVSPVLGFLAVGCLMGPHGLNIFSNTEADIELGDFGINFLLYQEGLTLTPERIKELGKFTGLGVLQLLFSVALIFILTFWGGPEIIKFSQELGGVLDSQLLQPVFDNPVESFCIAAAGALSSSAFVLPVVKSKGWERKPEGISSLSILLLQDLAVAPLLVLLPLLAGSGPSSSAELGILVAKATLGFGSVLVVGSYLLNYVFEFVAAARSTETFVAATLLVAVSMGAAAGELGLSASTGAFAAGVLLAGNKYRAQIQADIKPFEGILLGVFFITAGAGLDPAIVLQDWPTLFSGILAFVVLKAAIIFASGPTLGLSRGQAARVALTLSGGGEFALVLFGLAEELKVLPTDVTQLLQASVIISMALTPLLGEIGSYAGNKIEEIFGEVRGDSGLTASQEAELFDQIDTDGSGTIQLEELRIALLKLGFPYISVAEVFSLFDSDGNGAIDREEWKTGIEAGLLSDALSTHAIDSLSQPDAEFSKDALIICGFGELGKSVYSLLKAPGNDADGRPFAAGIEDGGLICFDLNPSRVSSGILTGAPVIFGDGTKMDLLKATGVTEPRAVIMTLRNAEQRCNAVSRLRNFLPEGTPIYSHLSPGQNSEQDMAFGATEVVSDTVESALRFANLVGVYNFDQSAEQIRQSVEQQRNHMVIAQDEMVAAIPGLSEDALLDLTEEIGCDREDILESWTVFKALALGRSAIPVSELKESLLRQTSEGPGDEAVLTQCLSLDELENEEVTFEDFLRSTFVTCEIG